MIAASSRLAPAGNVEELDSQLFPDIAQGRPRERGLIDKDLSFGFFRHGRCVDDGEGGAFLDLEPWGQLIVGRLQLLQNIRSFSLRKFIRYGRDDGILLGVEPAEPAEGCLDLSERGCLGQLKDLEVSLQVLG